MARKKGEPKRAPEYKKKAEGAKCYTRPTKSGGSYVSCEGVKQTGKAVRSGPPPKGVKQTGKAKRTGGSPAKAEAQREWDILGANPISQTTSSYEPVQYFD